MTLLQLYTMTTSRAVRSNSPLHLFFPISFYHRETEQHSSKNICVHAKDPRPIMQTFFVFSWQLYSYCQLSLHVLPNCLLSICATTTVTGNRRLFLIETYWRSFATQACRTCLRWRHTHPESLASPRKTHFVVFHDGCFFLYFLTCSYHQQQ